MAARAKEEEAKASASSPSSRVTTGSAGPSASSPRRVGAMASTRAAASARRWEPAAGRGAAGAAAMRRAMAASSHSTRSRTSAGVSPATMMPWLAISTARGARPCAFRWAESLFRSVCASTKPGSTNGTQSTSLPSSSRAMASPPTQQVRALATVACPCTTSWPGTRWWSSASTDGRWFFSGSSRAA